MLESRFKKQFRDYLAKHDFRVHPIENKIVAGMPDLLVMFSGVSTIQAWPTYRPIWIELKTLTTLTSNQLNWIKRHPEERVLMARYIQNSNKLKITRWYWEGVGLWQPIYEGKLNFEDDVIMSIIKGQM